MEHIVKFIHGHDCIKFECVHGSERCIPGAGGSHGVHGLTILFVVKGVLGAVQFELYTDWLPQAVAPDMIGHRNCNWGGKYVVPADLGYHSKTPRYEGQDAISTSCEFCDGQPCYYDGSGLNANDAMYALVNGGDEALWEFLEDYYGHVFHGEPYPQPVEYEMPLRAGVGRRNGGVA